MEAKRARLPVRRRIDVDEADQRAQEIGGIGVGTDIAACGAEAMRALASHAP